MSDFVFLPPGGSVKGTVSFDAVGVESRTLDLFAIYESGDSGAALGITAWRGTVLSNSVEVIFHAN